jgi:nucleoside-diphosphate kinase
MVIDMILNEGFEISAMEMFYLSKATIEEFYDVYKSVLPEYIPQIDHFISGPSIVLEVRQQNVVRTFREMVGPTDPEIAKYLRPHTIRAKFGQDRVRNAVHCTDLPEDGTIECEYFFNILQAYQ